MLNKILFTFTACFFFTFTQVQAQESRPSVPTQEGFSASARLLYDYLKHSPELPPHALTGYNLTRTGIGSSVRILAEIEEKNLPAFKALLTSENIKLTSEFGNIVALDVPLNRYLRLAEMPYLLRLEIEQAPSFHLDKVRTEIEADAVHAGTAGFPTALKGKNVILGVIDGGFDATHPTFRFPDGRSRVTRWWNFLDTLGPKPAGFDYGSEYTNSETILDIATDAEDELHGAHVAGICGGSGDTASKTKYVGIAPEAEMVWVAIPYGNNQRIYRSSTADGLKYIFDYASSQGKPCVINNSFGFFFGPHDGTDLLSRVCERITGRGKIIVASAGNNGERHAYFRKNFSGKEDSVKTIMRPMNYDRDGVRFVAGADIWGGADPDFKIKIGFYDLINREWVDSSFSTFTADTISKRPLIYTAKLPENPDIRVEVASSGVKANFNGRQNTTVKVFYRSSLDFVPVLHVYSKNNRIDMWAPYSSFGADFTDEYAGRPFNGYSKGDTLSNMSGTHVNSSSVIGVASYTVNNNIRNARGVRIPVDEPVGAIAEYSSKGPTADGRVKPDIAAPGHFVVSAGSTFDVSLNRDYLVERVNFGENSYPYLALTGTSMSGPVAAGAVALMLEANPNLHPSQIIRMMKLTSKKDNFTGPISEAGSIQWGAGKLNLKGLISEAYTHVGVSENMEALPITVFPNPGSELQLLAETEKMALSECTLTDLTGKEIFTKKFSEFPEDFLYRLPETRSLTEGVYFVRCKSGERMTTLKWVKSRD